MIEDEVRTAFSRYDTGGIDLNRLRYHITRESAQRRKRRGWVRTGIAAAVTAIALATAPTLVNTAAGLAPGTGATGTGPVNVLLLGAGAQGHYDGIVLVHLNAARSKVYLYTVNNGAMLPMPDGTIGPVANLADGIQAWVTRHFGVSLDAVAKMDVAGLEGMVESIGGIEVCSDRPLYTTIKTPGVLPAEGCPRLTGAEVGDLVSLPRGRVYGTTDRDVQRVLIGLLAELKKSVTDPERLHDLLRTARIAITGDLPLAELAWQLRGLQLSDVTGVTWPGRDPRRHGEEQALVLALRNDHMDRFVAAHPDWVTRIRP